MGKICLLVYHWKKVTTCGLSIFIGFANATAVAMHTGKKQKQYQLIYFIDWFVKW